MILGIVAVVLFLWAPMAVVLGTVGLTLSAIGMYRVKRNPELLAGYGMGIAGLALSVVAIAISMLILIAVIGL